MARIELFQTPWVYNITNSLFCYNIPFVSTRFVAKRKWSRNIWCVSCCSYCRLFLWHKLPSLRHQWCLALHLRLSMLHHERPTTISFEHSDLSNTAQDICLQSRYSENGQCHIKLMSVFHLSCFFIYSLFFVLVLSPIASFHFMCNTTAFWF